MQIARLLDPRPRTLSAKLIESLRALQLTWHYSRDELLTFYLTLAPMGGRLEGVRAASLAYLGKEPARLTLPEAALLIALPQSPTRRRPDLNPAAARSGVEKVLARLVERGAISDQARREALEDPLPASQSGRLSLPPMAAPHLADRLMAQAARNLKHNGTPLPDRITTTLDAKLQRRMEDLARQETQGMETGASVALLVVETASRKVRAAVGQANYFAAAGQVDMLTARRSPGSTLKPFVYGLGFESLALHPDTLVEDEARRFGDYAPRNFDRQFYGTVTIRQALQASLNLPAVSVLDQLGPERLAGRLMQAGARLETVGGHIGSLPLALGGSSISLADLAMLYAALADRGQAKPLIWTADQAPVLAPSARLMSPAAAWYVTDILAGAAPPANVGASGSDNRRIAYKTGTSYGFRDALSIGWSGNYTVAVWVGRPDGTPRPGLFARTTAAPLLFRAFDRIPGNSPLVVGPPPPGALPRERRQDLPAALRHLPVRSETLTINPLHLVSPPDDSDIAVTGEPLRLSARGGTPPYRWFINDLPLHADDWTPEGEGFAEAILVDATGTIRRSRFRLIPPPVR
jgi:penicillin-binding protein 1C